MLFLVDLPAPVHGMSTINQAMYDKVSAHTNDVDCINTVPSWAARHFGSPAWTMIKLFHSGLCIARFALYALLHRNTKVYRSVNGGIGQLFDVFYFSISRLFGLQLYIHHHSFSYLNNRSKLFALLNSLAGSKAVHICLGPTMAARLMEQYGVNTKQIRVVSNLAFFDTETQSLQGPSSPGLTIGHLANLTFEKGLDTFLEVCSQLYKAGIPFQALIAGPASSQAVQQALTVATTTHPDIVQYLGPLYGADKAAFFSRLDAFIFPSRYVNEAEPLVLYEAAIHGAFIAGTRRGCMGDIIDHFNGLAVDENSTAADSLSAGLKNASQHGTFLQAARQERKVLFDIARADALSELNTLVEELTRACTRT